MLSERFATTEPTYYQSDQEEIRRRAMMLGESADAKVERLEARLRELEAALEARDSCIEEVLEMAHSSEEPLEWGKFISDAFAGVWELCPPALRGARGGAGSEQSHLPVPLEAALAPFAAFAKAFVALFPDKPDSWVYEGLKIGQGGTSVALTMGDLRRAA